MKTILASLAIATASALGLASKAEAGPMAPVATTTAFHGRGGWSVGFGVSTGGGYGYRTYVPPSGYYTTQYQWVPTTVFSGYDAYGRPVYTTQYVQQAVQVWVPTGGYYTSAYGYAPRPSVSFGFGYRFR